MATTTGRVRAPELRGAGGWLNTAQPLQLADLRGRVVLLDFWTFCCINCLHVVEELRELETRFGNQLVVIGVHSPKFPHESDHAAVERAVRRHRIEHPVLDDPDMETWQRYGVRAWPTLVVIDPGGDIVAVAPGEGNGRAIGELVQRLLEGREAPTEPAFTPVPPQPEGELSFPGKVAWDGHDRIVIVDTGHDRIVVCDLRGAIVATHDGFHQPQGVRFDGDRILVCDTVAGALVAVAMSDGSRRVLAGGIQSPWDVLRREADLVVAEAGQHRLLSVPVEGGEFSVLAGTRAEGLRDGPAMQAHLAQPSGLTRLPDGTVVFADSEVSALRVLRDGRVETLVGAGLFEWGAADGDGESARLQHPLGVAALPDGSICIADTFNSALRVWSDGELRTVSLDKSLEEPGGLDVFSEGRVLVADTNNHRVLTVDPATGGVSELVITAQPREVLRGRAGSTLTLSATLELGHEALDPSQGPPVRVTLSAEPPSLLGPGPRSWALDGLPAAVSVPLGVSGDGTLTIDVIAATCHDDVCTILRDTREHALQVTA